MVPAQPLIQDDGGKDRKNAQGDHLLNDLELGGGKGDIADAVGGHLEAVLEEGDAPTDENHGQQGPLGAPEVFQMSIPRQGHEEV